MNRPNQSYQDRYYQYGEGEEPKTRASSVAQRLSRYNATPVPHHHPVSAYSGAAAASVMNVTAQEFNPYNSVYQTRIESHFTPQKVDMKPGVVNVGSSYSMYVSHVEDGPYSFYLQMKTDVEDTLPRLTALLEMSVAKPCSVALIPGSTIMVRSKLDNKFKRGIVKDVSPDVCTVYFADYGNSQSVPSKDIYELPPNAGSTYPLALKFSLANIKDQKYNQTVKDAFKQQVEGKLVLINVTSPETTAVIHYCDMFLNGSDIKLILNSLGSPMDYVGHPVLRDDSEVMISFSDGPSQFFIQYLHELDAINDIQEQLNQYCPTQPRFKDLSSIHIGDPVAALFEDNEWYRAMVVGFHEPTLTVLYVDYGNRWQVTADMMCSIKRELVSKWKTQAVECCLEGFENATADIEVTRMFSSITEGLEFTMKVKRLLSGTRLEVDLISKEGSSIAHTMKVYSASNELDNLKVTYDSKTGRNVSSEPPQEKKRIYNEHDNRIEEDYSNQNWKTDDRKGKWNSSDKGDSYRSNDNRYKRPQQTTEGSEKSWDGDRPSRKYNNDQGDFRKRNESSGAYNKGTFEKRGERSNYYKGGGGDADSADWTSNDTGGGGGGGWKNRSDDGNNWKSKSRDDDWKNKPRDNDWKNKSRDDDWKNKARDDDWKNKSKDDDWKSKRGEDGGRDYSGGGGYRNNREYDPNRKGKRQYEDRGDRGGKYGGGNDYKSGGNSYSKPYQSNDYGTNQSQTSVQAASANSESWDDDSTPAVQQTTVAETSTPVTSFTPVTSYNCLSIAMGSEFQAHLSHLDTPNHFYLQMYASEEILDEIRYTLDKDTAITSRPLSSNLLTIGTPVISKFSGDDQFYRAIVKQLQLDYVVVRFVDYGNTSVVNHNEVYSVTPDLSQREMQAICCNLIDIKPATNDSWDPDVNYVSYFEAEYLNIKVLGVKRIDGEEVFSVSITKPDGQSISQEFLNMKLALPVVMPFSPETDVEDVLPEGWIDRVSLLRDQYLHVTILKMLPTRQAVVRLKDVDLILVADALTHDLKEQSELIMWIKTVEEDRVSGRFFSLEGYGLDGGAAICPITPLPIVRSVDSFSVVHVEGTTLYVQKVSDANRVETLLNELYEKYSESPEETVEWQEEMLCCAMSSDGNWYRAKVSALSPPNVTVTFLDYGNQEELPSSNLRSLHPEYYFPQLALPILLPCNWAQPSPPIADYTEGHAYKAYIYRSKPGQWIMNLFESQGILLVKRLVNQGLAIDRKVNPFDEVNTVIGSKLLRGMTASVVVSHYDSPSSFWVHLQEHCLAVDTIQANLHEVVDSLEEIAMSDKVFAAQYSQDNSWYRAVEVEPGSSLVRFIDYGNTDTVFTKKNLTEELMKPLSGYAVPMTLCVRPVGGEWSDEALEKFDAFIDVKPPQKLIAEILSVNYKMIVDLKSGKESLSKVMIDGGFGVWDDFTPEPIKEFQSASPTGLTTTTDPTPPTDDTATPEIV